MAQQKKKDEWDEFDCPECDANNPYPDGFSPGETVFCQWCGCTFDVRKNPDNPEKFKLKQT